MTNLTARQARTRYLVLLALRWLPVGLLIPVFTLLPLQRGLTLSQLGMAAALQGVVVLALELPTGGLSDSLGRRPVLLAAGVIGFISLGIVFVADSFTMFAIAFAVQGVYRALDSGPLQAWYVDAVLADDPNAEISGGLSGGGAVLGLAIAAGSVIAGGLVALDPIPGIEALAAPVLASAAVQLAGVVALVVLLTEIRETRGWRSIAASVRGVPAVIGGSIRLLRTSSVLRALICVEVFWGFGMVTFEVLTPIRLAEVLDSTTAAAAIMGPAGAGAWMMSAVGAVLAAVVARRVGVALTAGALRILQGATVLGIALFAGPVGVIAAYLATYATHGASVPMHETLLHRQVTREHRTTVLSLNSMISHPAGAVGLVVLTALADGTSVPVAIVLGAVVLALAAPLYLPGWRAQRERSTQHAATVGT